MTQWIVEFYPDEDEDDSVQSYLKNLPDKDQGQLLRLIQLLAEIGDQIQQTKMDKLIEGSYRELRKNRYRIIYHRDRNKFILLVAFMKDTQKTRIEYIDLAKKRFADYQRN